MPTATGSAWPGCVANWACRAPATVSGERDHRSRAQANAALDAQVAALHAQYKRRYGRPRIVRELGQPIGHERVRKSLQRQGLRPLYRRPYRVTTDSDHRQPVVPNALDRRFDGWQINQAGVGDITYIATAQG